jgi:hypothetical protein
MIIDQPPQIIQEISPALAREIGCAGQWTQYRQGIWAETTDKNIEAYRGYMTRCINGETVPIFIGQPTSHKSY